MQLNLRSDIRRWVYDVYGPISYHHTETKKVANSNEDTYPLIDSLLTAYWKNDEDKVDRLARACESLSQDAIYDADLDIRVNE